MASTQETGHAKNVANFQNLIAFVQGYGATYNPSKNALKLPQLQALLADAEAKLSDVVAKNTAYNTKVNEQNNEIWFFRKYRWFLFWDEVAFIFENDIIIDITITEYLLGIELRNIYFFQFQTPEYRVVNSF